MGYVTFTPVQTIRIYMHYLGPVFFIDIALLYVLFAIPLMAVFKATDNKRWMAFIPILNSIILFKIAWGKKIYYLFGLIPFANTVFYVITYNRIRKTFGRKPGFTVGMLLAGPFFWLALAAGIDKKERGDINVV